MQGGYSLLAATATQDNNLTNQSAITHAHETFVPYQAQRPTDREIIMKGCVSHARILAGSSSVDHYSDTDLRKSWFLYEAHDRLSRCPPFGPCCQTYVKLRKRSVMRPTPVPLPLSYSIPPFYRATSILASTMRFKLTRAMLNGLARVTVRFNLNRFRRSGLIEYLVYRY